MTEIQKIKEKKDWRLLNFSVPISQSITSGKDFLIKGIAINEVVTRNGHKFMAKELENSAPSLRNKPILKDHNNSVDSIVGRTTNNVTFDRTNKNIPFEAKIMDPHMREMIADGRITSVSVGAMVHDLVESQDENEKGVYLAQGVEFVELSLVAVPADPNAGIAMALEESFNLKTKEVVQDENTIMEKDTNKSSNISGQDKIEDKKNPDKKETEGDEEEIDDNEEDMPEKDKIDKNKKKKMMDKEHKEDTMEEIKVEQKSEFDILQEQVTDLKKQLLAKEKAELEAQLKAKEVVEEVKPETKGLIGEKTEVVESSDYIIEKSNKGFAMYKK